MIYVKVYLHYAFLYNYNNYIFTIVEPTYGQRLFFFMCDKIHKINKLALSQWQP